MKLWLLFLAMILAGSPAAAQVTNVVVTGATATQAIITFEAVDPAKCTIEVSEAKSYTPLVPDLDPALFSGSNRCNRAGNIVIGNRVVAVIGQRAIARASDRKNYSRALQANSTHFFRITENGTETGSLTTANIPNGSTFGEKLLQDSAGNYLFPSLPDTPSYSFVDPLSGALIKRFGLDGDTTAGFGTPEFWSSGAVKMCAYTRVARGYYCEFPTSQGMHRLYWINPGSGVTSFLGVMRYPAGREWDQAYFSVSEGDWDPSDPNVTYALASSTGSPSKVILLKLQYTGRQSNQPPNSIASFTVTNLTPSSVNTVTDLLRKFDASYSPVMFPACAPHGVQVSGGHSYIPISCQRYQQDSPAWIAVLDLGNKQPLGSGGTLSVVAAMPMYASPSCRWCGHHSSYYIGDQPATYMIPQQLNNPISTGPYASSLIAGVTSAQTNFSVSGEPMASGSGIAPDGDPSLQAAAVGDYFLFEDGTGELVRITGKGSTNSWTVARGCYNPGNNMPDVCDGTGAATHASGATLVAFCVLAYNPSSEDIWWNFLADPHGTDSTDTNVIVEGGAGMYGGHRVTRNFYTTGVDVSENANIRLGAFPGQFNQPATRNLQNAPTFSGVSGFADGASEQKHPSYDQADAPTAEQVWYSDVWFYSFSNYADTAALVGGKTYTYKYTLESGNPFNTYKLPYFAVSGSHPMLDISGASSVLTDTAADNYKFCVAHIANECLSGSSAGDIYFNVPTLDYPYCYKGENGAPGGKFDICIQNTAIYGQAVNQFGLLAASGNGAGLSRPLVKGGLGAYRQVGSYANTHPVPDGSWLIYSSNVLQAGYPNTQILMVKVPPQPVPDGIDRTDFIQISVPTTAVAGATQAVVDFGDDGVNFYCTQRAEGCRAVSSTYNQATPFVFKTTDSYVGVTPGTSIILPVKPGHVIYYRVVYLDGNKNVIQTGPTQIGLDNFLSK